MARRARLIALLGRVESENFIPKWGEEGEGVL